MPGKARGRARGKARGGNRQQQQQQRRPGEQQAHRERGAAASPPGPVQAAEEFPELGARAPHRGDARDPRPGMAAEAAMPPVQEAYRGDVRQPRPHAAVREPPPGMPGGPIPQAAAREPPPGMPGGPIHQVGAREPAPGMPGGPIHQVGAREPPPGMPGGPIPQAAARDPRPGMPGGPIPQAGARDPRPGMPGGPIPQAAAIDPRAGMPGDVPRPPVEQMQQMAIGAGEAGAAGGRPRYEELHTRPAHVNDKRGESGRPLPLSTNFFRLETAPNWMLYQYHVDYNPPIESRRLKIALLTTHTELLGQVRAFDGMILYLPRRLQEQKTEVFSIRQYDDQRIRITITLTNELPQNSPQFIQVANIIFRRILSMIDMKQIGRHYFNPSLSVDIPRHKLQVMPGFVTSILQYESSVMLGVDIVHKILRSDTVLDIMYEMYQRRGQSFYDDVFKKFIGSIVMTRYNNKTYRCDDIEWDKHPTDTFKLRNGTDVTYRQYYKQHYDIDITDDDQPLLVSKPSKSDERRGQKEPILLVPELCTLTGLSDEVRADFQVMKDVATHTRIAPTARYEKIDAFMNQIKQNPEVSGYLGGWGMRFSDSLVNFNARVCPPERILQKNNVEVKYRPEDAEWSRDMRGKHLLVAVALENWVVISTRKDIGLMNDLISTLVRVGPPMGMMINKPVVVELPNDKNDTYIEALDKNITNNVQMVLCVVPSSKKDRYDAIKKMCCIERPVPSQVVLSRTIFKKQMLMSVATKIAIQLNCKLGGEVWAVEIPLGNTMAIGIDTYHDSASKGRSVGGIVFSLNRLMTRYYSRVNFQHNHQELIDGLETTFMAGLNEYKDVNGNLPERILVYRDGVGDGQLPAVYEHEVPQMIKAMKKTGGAAYDPKVAVIVVKKRINARFFVKHSGFQNPPPGTVVDSEVTKPEWYDFFLVSQSVRQGTVTPTHYNIIWDNTGLRPDHMQRLAYKLTHLYYNWPGTIRVPAPCQYAHKLAFLVGQSLHKEPSPALADRLYYL